MKDISDKTKVHERKHRGPSRSQEVLAIARHIALKVPENLEVVTTRMERKKYLKAVLSQYGSKN